MNQAEKEALIQRLIAAQHSSPVTGDHAQVALEGMARAGASRFGVHAYRNDAAFSACDLAPPLARMIDHTALKPETSEAQIRQLCDDAVKYCFASVCVNPSYVQLAATLLRGSPIAVCTVIGFPLGATKSAVKAREAELAVDDGATELDMVINVGFLKSKRYEAVEADIASVVEVARRKSQSTDIVSKVILETALLTDEEKVIACILSKNAGANFVKTSTGFSSAGATAEDVALMRRVVGPGMGVKASGGVRSQEDAETMIAHGATRLGASASVAIMKGLKGQGTY